MDKDKFERITKYCTSKGFDDLVGWAIWEKDINNVSMFDEEELKETIPRLKDNIVIMGLNASTMKDESKVKKWGGFHYQERDSWLRELVERNSEKLEGAYMTDVFKIRESNAKEVKKEVKNDKKRSEEFDLLEEELNKLGDNLTIILIGNDAEKYFRMFEKEKKKIGNHHVYKIPHYSQYTKKEKGTLIDTYIAEAEDQLKLELYVKHNTILGR